MYSPPGGGAGMTLAAADNTVTVGGSPAARNVKVAKQLDSSYLTDFAAAVAARLSLATDAKTLGADTGALALNAWTTVLTSADLAVGTWLVVWSALTKPAGSNERPMSRVIAGTAVATFAGQLVAQSAVSLANFPAQLLTATLVTITTHGTLLMQVNDPDNAGCIVKASTVVGAVAGSTGYIAVKVA